MQFLNNYGVNHPVGVFFEGQVYERVNGWGTIRLKKIEKAGSDPEPRNEEELVEDLFGWQ